MAAIVKTIGPKPPKESIILPMVFVASVNPLSNPLIKSSFIIYSANKFFASLYYSFKPSILLAHSSFLLFK